MKLINKFVKQNYRCEEDEHLIHDAMKLAFPGIMNGELLEPDHGGCTIMIIDSPIGNSCVQDLADRFKSVFDESCKWTSYTADLRSDDGEYLISVYLTLQDDPEFVERQQVREIHES